MKKMDPRKQLLEETAARAADSERLKRTFRGEPARVTRAPFTWQDPILSFAKPKHLADAYGAPFYIGDRVMLVDTLTNRNGCRGVVVPREDMPHKDDSDLDNGFNVAVLWDEAWSGPKAPHTDRYAWVGQSFLVHDLTFDSINDVEDYLEGS